MTVQGQRVTYSYDGDGMMVARTAGGSTTRFYLDGQRVINEGDGTGAITAAMFRGAGMSLGRQVGTAPTAYYLYNRFYHMGLLRMVIKAIEWGQETGLAG